MGRQASLGLCLNNKSLLIVQETEGLAHAGIGEVPSRGRAPKCDLSEANLPPAKSILLKR